jgi:hypothetical protein
MVLREVLQLHAQTASGHRMVGIPRHLDELAVLDMVKEGARVGAILRACPADDMGLG